MVAPAEPYHDTPHAELAGDPGGVHAPRDRWLAALAYVGPLCLLSMFARNKTPFLRWHAQQGFVLLFLEAVSFALVVVFQSTLGRIPVLGLIVEIVLKLAVLVVFLLLSIVGFVKALAGEAFRFPVIEDYAERVPLQD